jgi:hypothetical protein
MARIFCVDFSAELAAAPAGSVFSASWSAGFISFFNGRAPAESERSWQRDENATSEALEN